MTEYEACILGIEADIDLRIKILDVYDGSALVIIQVKVDWEARYHNLISYKEHVLKLIPYFDEITFHHIPQKKDQLVNALATLSSIFKVKWRNKATYIRVNYLGEPAYCLAAEDEYNGHPWFYDIMSYLESKEYP